MAKTPFKITLSPSRDIPFDKLVLSQANVRTVKTGVSIVELAEDIARRTLLQSLNVRPVFDAEGKDTELFEVPAGGRRYRALALLVGQKRLARNAPIPCIVRLPGDDISAEEDSLAENAFREELHPLDQFRAMQVLVDQGDDIDAIAAHFMTTPAVVRQRLKLASVSPKLHAIYADDGMTLEQLMAFSICEDHQRQEQLWDLLTHGSGQSPGYIRSKLTENAVRAGDKRTRFVTLDAYVAEGGGVMRDLFDDDRGGWLTDPALLDRLVAEKLAAEAAKVRAEGWKWVSTGVDLPWDATRGLRSIAGSPVPLSAEEQTRLAALQQERDGLESDWAAAPEIPSDVDTRLNAIDGELASLSARPLVFEPSEMAHAGAFVSIDAGGTLTIERGYVRPEDEGAARNERDGGNDPITADLDEDGAGEGDGRDAQADASLEPDEVGEGDHAASAKPLSDRLVAELTAWRTLALQDALAQQPGIAFVTVLHALVLRTFSTTSADSCLQLILNPVSFTCAPPDLRDGAPAKALAERHAQWAARLRASDQDVWDTLLAFDETEQMALFAHCVSQAVNAQRELVPKYDNGRVSRHGVERRVAHSDVLARAVNLDVADAGWRPTLTGYFNSVTKARILADVAEGRGQQFADMIGHLKKADMAREAERLLADTGWLPEPMRTSEPEARRARPASDRPGTSRQLPAFLEQAEHDEPRAEAPDVMVA